MLEARPFFDACRVPRQKDIKSLGVPTEDNVSVVHVGVSSFWDPQNVVYPFDFPLKLRRRCSLKKDTHFSVVYVGIHFASKGGHAWASHPPGSVGTCQATSAIDFSAKLED